jgi:hypothetical protein
MHYLVQFGAVAILGIELELVHTITAILIDLSVKLGAFVSL